MRHPPSLTETLLTLPLAGRLVSAREISARLGRPAATFYRWEAIGQFPQRIRLEGKAVAWRGDDIQAWLDSRRELPRNPAGYLLPSEKKQQHDDEAPKS
jgi:predicted DNA-binding transcriptional regulator AlpA